MTTRSVLEHLRLRMHEGKIEYPTATAAAEAARALVRKGKANASWIGTYRCWFGQHWHVGHHRPKATPAGQRIAS